MSWIKLGRSSTWSIERRGRTTHERSSEICDTALHFDMPTEARMLEAASIEAKHALAHADAFAIAAAMAHNARVPTGDPEILDDGDPTWQVVDLRP